MSDIYSVQPYTTKKGKECFILVKGQEKLRGRKGAIITYLNSDFAQMMADKYNAKTTTIF